MSDVKRLKLKNIICVLLVSIVVQCAFGVSAAASPDTVIANYTGIKVILDGKQLSFDVPPTIEKGRTLAPLRVIFEALGAEVKWDEATQTVTATRASTEIKLTIGAQTGYRNGSTVALDVPAKVIKGRTMVPVRFISEALGAEVNWDGVNQTIVITTIQADTAAVVNGEKISLQELENRMQKVKLSMESEGVSFDSEEGLEILAALRQQALDDMITQKLITQEARKQGVFPSEEEVTKRYNDLVASFGDEKRFFEALETYDYTVEEIRELIICDEAKIRLFDKVTAGVTMTAAEVRQWYDEHRDNWVDPAKIGARTIMVKFDDPDFPEEPRVGRNQDEAERLAGELIVRLDGGADFATLARENSEDEISRSDGGLIKGTAGESPYAAGTTMPRVFDQAAMALKPGTYTKTPIKINNSFYIIKLESLTPQRQLPFSEVEEQVREIALYSEKQDKFSGYFDNLRNNSQIIINL